jgi:2-polyprenyl-3-methyl-5-hydroxy-6-metoxy-1,4-benzoquinol methylase
MHPVGIQQEGSSHPSIKRMAWKALRQTGKDYFETVADIGGGAGAFAAQLAPIAGTLHLLDADPGKPAVNVLPHACNLNEEWPIADQTIDLLISLEVIEHLENPRHFFRQMNRILKPGAFALITTPYNLNFFARLLFLFKGQHRHFQDYSYPAHITVLLPIDLIRLAAENDLQITGWFYNHHDVLPLFKKGIFWPSSLFSNSIGVLLQKPY